MTRAPMLYPFRGLTLKGILEGRDNLVLVFGKDEKTDMRIEIPRDAEIRTAVSGPTEFRATKKEETRGRKKKGQEKDEAAATPEPAQ